MELRTAEIIMCLKDKHSLDEKYANPRLGDYYDAIAMYMGDRCDVDPWSYTKSEINGIVRIAVLDYITSCDNPAELLIDYFDACNLDDCYNGGIHDECQRWCIALSLAKVRDSKTGNWLNGFNDSLVHHVFPTY